MEEISFTSIMSPENLFLAWKEFVRGKKHKKDVMEFSVKLAENIFNLHHELKSKTYHHGGYQAFNISDPKPRNIHKASVRDRLLHHAIYRILYFHFDEKFIHDSYSCRQWKGTHKALRRFEHFGRKVSLNNTRHCYVLKCDVRKFFASIDQRILLDILRKHISDSDTIWLLERVIESFSSTQLGKGLPLGNLTSQLLVNIYMNEFDQCMKHTFKIKYYIRYADDFVIFNHDKSILEELLPKIGDYLEETLKLQLHPDKVFITVLSSGVDFLGWMHFFNHRVLRCTTKKRMMRNVQNNLYNQKIIQSYLGLLGHGNAYTLGTKVQGLSNYSPVSTPALYPQTSHPPSSSD